MVSRSSSPRGPLGPEQPRVLLRERRRLIVAYLGSNVIQYFEEFENIHDDPKVRRFTPEAVVEGSRYWRHVPEEELDFIEGAADGKKILDRSGYVTVGAHGNRQGIGMQWELWTFVMGGFTPLEAIRAATYDGALKIGYERDLGSLEPGKLADFLVLDDNPLDDIRNTGKIWYVVKNGFVWDGESMTEVWPEMKALHRFHWQTEEEMGRWAAPEAGGGALMAAPHHPRRFTRIHPRTAGE